MSDKEEVETMTGEKVKFDSDDCLDVPSLSKGEGTKSKKKKKKKKDAVDFEGAGSENPRSIYMKEVTNIARNLTRDSVSVSKDAILRYSEAKKVFSDPLDRVGERSVIRSYRTLSHHLGLALSRILSAGCWDFECFLTVHLLITLGARVDVRDRQGRTILHNLIRSTKRPEHLQGADWNQFAVEAICMTSRDMFNLITQEHGDISGANAAYTTFYEQFQTFSITSPLPNFDLAISWNEVCMIYVLQNGANHPTVLDVIDSKMTAFGRACDKSAPEGFVEILMNAGANPLLGIEVGTPPSRKALEYQANFLKKKSIVSGLSLLAAIPSKNLTILEKFDGANLYALGQVEDVPEKNIFNKVFTSKDEKWIAALLNMGVSPNAGDSYNHTALAWFTNEGENLLQAVIREGYDWMKMDGNPIQQRPAFHLVRDSKMALESTYINTRNPVTFEWVSKGSKVDYSLAYSYGHMLSEDPNMKISTSVGCFLRYLCGVTTGVQPLRTNHEDNEHLALQSVPCALAHDDICKIDDLLVIPHVDAKSLDEMYDTYRNLITRENPFKIDKDIIERDLCTLGLFQWMLADSRLADRLDVLLLGLEDVILTVCKRSSYSSLFKEEFGVTLCSCMLDFGAEAALKLIGIVVTHAVQDDKFQHVRDGIFDALYGEKHNIEEIRHTYGAVTIEPKAEVTLANRRKLVATLNLVEFNLQGEWIESKLQSEVSDTNATIARMVMVESPPSLYFKVGDSSFYRVLRDAKKDSEDFLFAVSLFSKVVFRVTGVIPCDVTRSADNDDIADVFDNPSVLFDVADDAKLADYTLTKLLGVFMSEMKQNEKPPVDAESGDLLSMMMVLVDVLELVRRTHGFGKDKKPNVLLDSFQTRVLGLTDLSLYLLYLRQESPLRKYHWIEGEEDDKFDEQADIHNRSWAEVYLHYPCPQFYYDTGILGARFIPGKSSFYFNPLTRLRWSTLPELDRFPIDELHDNLRLLQRGSDGVPLLHALISEGVFDFAVRLLRRCSEASRKTLYSLLDRKHRNVWHMVLKVPDNPALRPPEGQTTGELFVPQHQVLIDTLINMGALQYINLSDINREEPAFVLSKSLKEAVEGKWISADDALGIINVWKAQKMDFSVKKKEGESPMNFLPPAVIQTMNDTQEDGKPKMYYVKMFMAMSLFFSDVLQYHAFPFTTDMLWSTSFTDMIAFFRMLLLDFGRLFGAFTFAVLYVVMLVTVTLYVISASLFMNSRKFRKWLDIRTLVGRRVSVKVFFQSKASFVVLLMQVLGFLTSGVFFIPIVRHMFGIFDCTARAVDGGQLTLDVTDNTTPCWTTQHLAVAVWTALVLPHFLYISLRLGNVLNLFSNLWQSYADETGAGGAVLDLDDLEGATSPRRRIRQGSGIYAQEMGNFDDPEKTPPDIGNELLSVDALLQNAEQYAETVLTPGLERMGNNNNSQKDIALKDTSFWKRHDGTVLGNNVMCFVQLNYDLRGSTRHGADLPKFGVSDFHYFQPVMDVRTSQYLVYFAIKTMFCLLSVVITTYSMVLSISFLILSTIMLVVALVQPRYRRRRINALWSALISALVWTQSAAVWTTVANGTRREIDVVSTDTISINSTFEGPFTLWVFGVGWIATFVLGGVLSFVIQNIRRKLRHKRATTTKKKSVLNSVDNASGEEEVPPTVEDIPLPKE